MSLLEEVITDFRRCYDILPSFVARAPGRINLIGGHTDYNNGYVLPMAIDRSVWIAFRPRLDQYVIVHSLDYDQTISFALDELKNEKGGWIEYLKGVSWSLKEAGYELKGWEGTLAGDVPVGAGLSSSAALEMSTARVFSCCSNLPWDPINMARLTQKAENHWIGVNCGIMDQLVSALGKAGHALLIDCQSLDTQDVPIPPDIAIMVLDTSVRRGLVESAYNERREQCEIASNILGVPSLRDISLQEFQKRVEELDSLSQQRARHVISENARTLQAAAAMFRKDTKELGQLMVASHASLRDEFEVSIHELNIMVKCSMDQQGCYGARMTGAGFGGCVIALVKQDLIETFTNTVIECYQKATGNIPCVYHCVASNGVELIRP
jgi:galactokinase